MMRHQIHNLFAGSKFALSVFVLAIVMGGGSTPSQTLIGTTTDLGNVKLELIDGALVEASISAIDQLGKVSGDGIPDGLNVQEILSLTTSRESQAASHKVAIHMNRGGKIMASNPQVRDERVKFKSDSGVDAISLQAAVAIVWESSSLVESTLKDRSKQDDVVVVQTNKGEQLVPGILEAIDGEFVRLNYEGVSRKIGLSKVKAVLMADIGLSSSQGSLATIDLIDRSRVVGLVEKLEEDQLQVAVAGGAAVNIDAAKVVRISIASDRLAYLSDAEPIEAEESSIFSVQRDWQRDRSVAGNRLKIRLANSEKTIEFNKGLGTQSSSLLLFANENDFDRFTATVGIDAETKGRGDCQMVVRGDGIELWSKRVRGSDGPSEINVDISGMKEVALIVYPGAEFDLGDHANWGNAKFLKTK